MSSLCVTEDVFDNRLLKKGPKLKRSLKIDQSYTKKKEKSLLRNRCKTWPWHRLTLLLENFLFLESLDDLFLVQGKAIKWPTNSKKKSVQTGNDFELCTDLKSNLTNNLGNVRDF